MKNFPLGSGLFEIPDEPSPYPLGSGLFGQPIVPLPPGGAEQAAPTGGGAGWDQVLSDPRLLLGMSLLGHARSRSGTGLADAMKDFMTWQATAGNQRLSKQRIEQEGKYQDATLALHRDELPIKQGNLEVNQQNARTNEGLRTDQAAKFRAEADAEARKAANEARWNEMVGQLFPGLFAPGSTAPPLPPAIAPSSPVPAPAGGIPVPGSALPPAMRPTDNNVGNLRPVGASTGFRQFATPEEGWNALRRDLTIKGARGLDSIAKILNVYAPPSENDTAAYIQDVSQKLGVAPDAPLDMGNPKIVNALATAMAMHEKGPTLNKAGATGPGAALPAAVGGDLDPQQITKLGLLASLMNRPGAAGIVAAGQAMQPKHIPAGGFLQAPGGGLIPVPDPQGDKRLALQERDTGAHELTARTNAAAKPIELGLEDRRTAATEANSAANVAHQTATTQKSLQDQKDEKFKRVSEYQDTAAAMDRLESAAARLASNPSLWAVTGLGGKAGIGRLLPGTEAANAHADWEELKSKAKVDVMKQLKSLSAQGSTGFGQLSDQENRTLEIYITNLDKAKTPEAFKASLDQLVDYARQSKARFADRLKSMHGDEALSEANAGLRGQREAAAGMTPGKAIPLDEFLKSRRK